MGWMAPLRHRRANLVFLKNHQEWEPSMSEITIIGLDLAKHVFQVHGIDAQGTTVLRKRLGGQHELCREHIQPESRLRAHNSGFILIGGCSEDVEASKEVYFSPGRDD